MRNIETLRNYFLGKDPQLKETMADNSLRLIGIPGREFVLKAEMYKRLKELADTDADLQNQIDAVVQAVEYEERARRNADATLQNNIDAEELARSQADNTLQGKINDEKQARIDADTALSGRVTTLENWKNNNTFVYMEDLVTALANYYTKAQIDQLISGTLTYEVVQTLPTTNISPRTIYLVPNGTSTPPDYYDEYLYTGDVTQAYDPTKWELIGTTNIDLSDYVTKSGLLSSTGQATNNTMHQKAITDALALKYSKSEGDIVKPITTLTLVNSLDTGIYKVSAGTGIEYNGGMEPEIVIFGTDTYMFVENDGTTHYFIIFESNSNTDENIINYGYMKTAGQGIMNSVYLSNIQVKTNLVTTITASSTNTQYPSAKLLYDELAEKQAEIDDLYAQIPTATASDTFINLQDSSNLPIKDFAMLGNATQADTPTPDSPQDIHVVTGDNTVNVLGKNLFDKSQATLDKYVNTANGLLGDDTNKFATDYIAITPNIDYVANGASNTSNTRIYGAVYDSNKNFIEAIDKTISVFTFKVTNTNAKYIRLTGLKTDIDTYQLEQGTAVTTYEPYTETTQLLSNLPELAKIGDYTDKIYKSGDKWYKYGAIGKLVIDEDSTIKIQDLITANSKFIWRYTTAIDMAGTGSRANLISNYYVGDTTVYAGNDAIGSYVNTNNLISFATLLSTIGATTSTTSEQALVLLKTWLTNNNVIVYYPLATPTTTEITDTTLISQLENILKMRTIKNTTNMWIEPSGTNAQGGLTIVYRQELTTGGGTTYTAGANVQIVGNVISATDTTYTHFTGTDGLVDGTAGLVPAPTTSAAGKFLNADGTWQEAGSNYTAGDYIDITNNTISVTGIVSTGGGSTPLTLTTGQYYKAESDSTNPTLVTEANSGYYLVENTTNETKRYTIKFSAAIGDNEFVAFAVDTNNEVIYDRINDIYHNLTGSTEYYVDKGYGIEISPGEKIIISCRSTDLYPPSAVLFNNPQNETVLQPIVDYAVSYDFSPLDPSKFVINIYQDQGWQYYVFENTGAGAVFGCETTCDCSDSSFYYITDGDGFVIGQSDSSVTIEDGYFAVYLETGGKLYINCYPPYVLDTPYVKILSSGAPAVLDNYALKSEIPVINYGTTDLTPGVSPLNEGEFYFVYE